MDGYSASVDDTGKEKELSDCISSDYRADRGFHRELGLPPPPLDMDDFQKIDVVRITKVA